MLNSTQSLILRYLSSFIIGCIGILEPTINVVFLCLVFIIMDIYSAWDLGKRVKKKYNIDKEDFGKFSSEKAGYAFDTLLKLIVLILGANIIDILLLPKSVNLASYVAVAFCAWEMWSILENFSSENDKGWAKLLQKVMVNKAKRLLDDLDIEEIITEVNKDKKEQNEEIIN